MCFCLYTYINRNAISNKYYSNTFQQNAHFGETEHDMRFQMDYLRKMVICKHLLSPPFPCGAWEGSTESVHRAERLNGGCPAGKQSWQPGRSFGCFQSLFLPQHSGKNITDPNLARHCSTYLVQFFFFHHHLRGDQLHFLKMHGRVMWLHTLRLLQGLG